MCLPEDNKIHKRKLKKDDVTLPEEEQVVNDTMMNKKYETVDELTEDEVAIDGIVYDISEFNHPGGDVIKMFGGNDVSNVYKFNHLYHSSKALEKMKKVGVLKNYHQAYTFESEFAKELKREVMKVVRPGTEFATTSYYCRVFFHLALAAFFQIYWVVNGSSVKLAFANGVAQALVALNISHDANHGAISRKPWINDLLGFTVDFVGGNKWNWLERHYTHHAYLNDPERDPDSRDGEPLVVFHKFPKGDSHRKWHHQFQAFFIIPLICFFWFGEIINPQVLTLEHEVTHKLKGKKFKNSYLKSKIPVALAFRALYLYMNVINPFLWHDRKTAFLHFLLAGMTGSISLASVFLVSHNFEGAEKDPIYEYDTTGKQVCWYKTQAEGASTYGGIKSGYVTGGLNYQIEHHCFPRINSCHYPTIAPICKRICEKHGVRYAGYPTFFHNMWSTLKHMHQTGNGFDLELARPLSGAN